MLPSRRLPRVDLTRAHRWRVRTSAWPYLVTAGCVILFVALVVAGYWADHHETYVCTIPMTPAPAGQLVVESCRYLWQ